MRANSVILAIVLCLGTGFAGTTNLQIVPTTTVATESGNNTSAADNFTAQSNGNPAPGSTAKMPIRGLMYSGATTKIYAHFMPWFGGANHMWVGYRSDDRSQVNKQVNDMMSRGYDGAIVDWYGPDHARENNTTLYLRDDAETRGGAFVFAVMEDVGSLNACASTAGCDVTQKMINDLNYVASTYYPSPAYMRVGGRPVMFFFGVDKYTIDWTRARAGVNGNPLFIFRQSGGFTHAQSDGAFSWVGISTTSSSMGLGYLDDFYSTGLKYPAKQTFGSSYPGFDNTLAAWVSNPPKIVDRQCGQTWLASLNEAGKYYSVSKQLPWLQTVTWNDYEEGSELETGIDGCLAVSAAVTGSQLSWTLSGAPSAVDHYNVFISTDGVNLMKLASLDNAQSSLDLATFALATGSYTLYVQAYAKASIHNAFSNVATYTLANRPPSVALALDTTSGIAPQTVNATASASDSDGIVASTSIDFGDGSGAVSDTSASHAYTGAGTYTVTATATDNLGASTSATQTVTITANQPPVAGLALSPGSGIAPLSVTASSSTSTDPDGSIASSSIDFGDGTVMAGPTAAHTYSSTGAHTVKVTVTDNKGASSSATGTVTVNPNQPPVAALNVTPASGIAPVTVSASTAASYDSDGSVASSSIDFGDGTVLAGPSASHVYSTTGVKTITATVTDNLGATATATATVTVNANQSPVAALSVTPASGIAPVTVSASTAASADVDGTIVSSKIDFGDGTVVNGASSSHVYSTAGTKTITATVTDNLGATGTTSTTVTVNANQAPVARLSVTPTSGTAPVTVTASTAASSDADGTIASSKIDFGDGTVVTGASASHVYSTAGTKTITATVTDNLGATSSTTATVTVTASNQLPVAALTVSPTTGVAALTVTASTAGSYDPDGSVASAKISWGDGTTTTGASGSHTYTKIGSYTVTATVTDNSGASASTSKTVSATAGVKVGAPLPGVSYTSPVRVTASAVSLYRITTMRVYVDSVNRYSISGASLSTYITMTKGTHTVVVQAWDSSGQVYKAAAVTITVK